MSESKLLNLNREIEELEKEIEELEKEGRQLKQSLSDVWSKRTELINQQKVILLERDSGLKILPV